MKQQQYSNNYFAKYMREKRTKMIKIDPIFSRQYVWIVEAGDKQIVFKNKRDIKISKINKKDLRKDCVKAF